MHRLFVAIEIPDRVKEELAAIREELPGARWVRTDQMHLTLRFIGEVDDQTLSSVKEALSAVHGSPFQMAVTGIGHFPPSRLPRVLWVGLQAENDLFALQQEVEHAVQHAGVPGDSRPFAPHITIARLKGTPPGTIRAFEQRHGPLESPPFPVTSFHLFRSIFSENAVSHVKIAEYPLG